MPKAENSNTGSQGNLATIPSGSPLSRPTRTSSGSGDHSDAASLPPLHRSVAGKHCTPLTTVYTNVADLHFACLKCQVIQRPLCPACKLSPCCSPVSTPYDDDLYASVIFLSLFRYFHMCFPHVWAGCTNSSGLPW